MSEERQCAAPWCGKVLLRKRLERSEDFAVRSYCGKSCAATHANMLRRQRIKLTKKN